MQGRKFRRCVASHGQPEPHADDAPYLDALHRAGINWLPWMQSSEISAVPA
jgi:hypothetical protein